jgi:dihydrolipoamide dehydrogenase
VYAKPDGFPTPLSDSERPTGACASGAEAGESLDQAVLAIRARVPLDGQRDTIQPSPAFAAIYVAASKGRCSEMAVSRHPVR